MSYRLHKPRNNSYVESVFEKNGFTHKIVDKIPRRKEKKDLMQTIMQGYTAQRESGSGIQSII